MYRQYCKREHPHGVRYSGDRAKKADLDLPCKSQEECAPRRASKVSPYYEVDESIFGLSVTQLHGFATVLSNQPKIQSKVSRKLLHTAGGRRLLELGTVWRQGRLGSNRNMRLVWLLVPDDGLVNPQGEP